MKFDNAINVDWPAPENICAFTTLRHGFGVSKRPFDEFNLGNRNSEHGDNPKDVETNREQLRTQFSLPSAPHWLKQVHGIDILRFDCAPVLTGDFMADEPVADASVTSQRNVVLSILTADCVPVLFCNIDGTEIAAAHAGWRGLADGILENTVYSMKDEPRNIIAWLGPAAGPSVYEVSVEVRNAFLQHEKNAEVAFVQTRQNHWLVDLYQLARMRLNNAGVTKVYGGDHCTISEPDIFFSHRRDRLTGRMASIIWLT